MRRVFALLVPVLAFAAYPLAAQDAGYEEIVEETREKLHLGEDEAARLAAALKRLSDVA